MKFQIKGKVFFFIIIIMHIFFLFRFSSSTWSDDWKEEPGCLKQWLHWVCTPRWQTQWTASRSQTRGPACPRWTNLKADLILKKKSFVCFAQQQTSNFSTRNLWCTLTQLPECQLRWHCLPSVASFIWHLYLSILSKQWFRVAVAICSTCFPSSTLAVISTLIFWECPNPSSSHCLSDNICYL